MNRTLFAVLLTTGLAACLGTTPTINTDDTDPEPEVDTDPVGDTDPPKEAPKSGVLSGDQITVTWQWVDEWEGGNCMAIEIQNHEEPAFNWEVQLGLDGKIDALLYARGAKVTPFGNRLIINGNNNEELGAEAIDVEICTEPERRVERITDETMPPEPTEVPLIYGIIEDQDGMLALKFQQSGRSNGGDCLLLAVKNLSSSETIAHWDAVAHFREAFDLTDSAGMFPIPVGDSQIKLLPGPTDVELPPFGEASGMICMNEIQEPELFRTTYEILVVEDTGQ